MGAQDISNVEKPKALLGIRHVQAIMICFAFVICFAMRVNMSLAIVAMTDSSQKYTFDWSMQVQSIVLSSFFWGYVVLQIPAGELAAKFGGKTFLILCVGINSAVTLLVPACVLYGGWKLVCVGRVLQGLSQGFLFPTTHNLISKWVPIEEKSRLGTIVYSGAQCGTALQLISAGYIAEYFGWPTIFYSTGLLGVIWTVVYILLGASSPQSSRFISQDERLYIQTSLKDIDGQKKKMKTPWKSIFTSLSFISLVIVHCGQNWGFWTLMTEIPSYFSKVLQVDMKSNGLMSALPYLAMYLLGFPFGFLSDFVLRKKWLSLTAARKISNTIGHFGPAISLIGLSYSPEGNVAVAVALLTVIVGLNAGHYTGYLLVHIDMSPNFGGTLMGITNFAANLISIVAPLAAGAIIQDETDPIEWRKVFYLSSFIYIACNTFFLIFGTSKTQAWNEPEGNTSKEIRQEDKTPEDKTEKVV